MKFLLVLVFFLSGTAGLVFETIWFRLAGLAFGNTVFASSLVLSSFMAGLAIGNFLAARRGTRITRPLRTYAMLEVLVGVVGLVLVLLLPHLPELFAPLFRPFLDRPEILNPLRFGLAFFLLVIPTAAMGMTLPLMVKAMTAWRVDFSGALGWLYGVNTLGAMCGAVLGEWVLVPALGVTASGIAAASFNFAAALGAVVIHARLASRDREPEPEVSAPAPSPARASGIGRFLFGALFTGAILLALEVVWFRFLQLFVLSTTRGFAIMLLVVLLGIGTGGVASAAWLKLRPNAYRLLPHLSFLAGLLTMGAYIAFASAPASASGSKSVELVDTFVLCARLMFPVSFVSGLLFTLLGRAVFERHSEETGAVGWVTLYNTVGAALGAIVAGWLLVPTLGVERSIFFLALAYTLVALSTIGRHARAALALVASLFVATSLLFPFGLMENHFVPVATEGYRSDTSEIVEVREGLNETIVYVQTRWKGEPYSARLVTNSFSMTATGLRAERYMKYFAYWPLAFSPKIDKALLISYGLGITASALTQADEIEQIDVVDISYDIIDMSDYLYPEAGLRPLNDPRARVFIEDGRFFLLTRNESYDLITGEPPPLMVAGVVNLYTEEYFSLLKSRLNEGGFVTYWLPIVHLSPEDARSVIKGFCNVFEDCSLWRGARLELVMVGSRNAPAVDPDRFDRSWKSPRTAKDLARIGLETPGLLLSTFVGDAAFLARYTEGAAPLVDDHPYRLSPEMAPPDVFQDRVAAYIALVRDVEVEERYRTSAYLKKVLPAGLYQQGLDAAPFQSLTELGLNAGPGSLPLYLEQIDRILTETHLRTPALWLMGDHHETSGVIESLAARGAFDPEVHYHLGLRHLAGRDFDAAEKHFREAQATSNGNRELDYYRVLALAYGGRLDAARELAETMARGSGDEGFWAFCERRFGLGLELKPTAPR